MPTPTGAETIAERLERLRSELADARLVVQRVSRNGQSVSLGGAAVTEMSAERAAERITRLESQIRSLEARLAGGRAATGLAHTVTRIET